MAIKFSNAPARPIEPKSGKAKAGKKDTKSNDTNLELELSDDNKGKAK